MYGGVFSEVQRHKTLQHAKPDTYAREPLQQDPYSIQRKLLKQRFNLRMPENIFLAFVGFPHCEKKVEEGCCKCHQVE